MTGEAPEASPREATSRARTIGGGTVMLAVLAIPLWTEFRVPGNWAWNAFLAALLIGIAVAAVIAHRYFRAHAGEIGEARFTPLEEDSRG